MKNGKSGSNSRFRDFLQKGPIFFFLNTTNVLKSNFIKNGWSWYKHLLSYLVKKNIVSSFDCFCLSVLSAPDAYEAKRNIGLKAHWLHCIFSFVYEIRFF